jgi:hypothetical protein
MAIFNSYVKLPEGITNVGPAELQTCGLATCKMHQNAAMLERRPIGSASFGGLDSFQFTPRAT